MFEELSREDHEIMLRNAMVVKGLALPLAKSLSKRMYDLGWTLLALEAFQHDDDYEREKELKSIFEELGNMKPAEKRALRRIMSPEMKRKKNRGLKITATNGGTVVNGSGNNVENKRSATTTATTITTATTNTSKTRING